MGGRSLTSSACGLEGIPCSMLTTALRAFIRGRGSMLALLLLSFITLLVPPTAAVLVNVTVDDTFGSSDGTVIPTYLPNNASWHLGSPTEQCDVCALKPSKFDTDQIFDQSWHHATYFPGTPVQVSVTFRGTAVYVYNVIPNYVKGANTFVDLSFAIDGAPVGAFTHTPDASATVLYNHLVYSATGLSDAVHTLVMGASGSRSSLVFFDYLIYTTEVDGAAAATIASGSPSPSSTAPIASSSSTNLAANAPSSNSHTAAIAGGVVGGVVALLVIPTLFFFLFCRQRRTRANASTVDPYTFPSPSPDSALPPLMGELSPSASRSMYSNTTATGLGPSPASSSRTLETKRELELKRRMEALQRSIAAHHHLHQHHLERHRPPAPQSQSLPESDGAVQALQAEIAALRNVLSGMAHAQPAICASEVLPRYEEARWSAAANAGSGTGRVW